jgi:hypothetical protein
MKALFHIRTLAVVGLAKSRFSVRERVRIAYEITQVVDRIILSNCVHSKYTLTLSRCLCAWPCQHRFVRFASGCSLA